MSIWKNISRLNKVVVITFDNTGSVLKAGMTNSNSPEQTFGSLDEVMQHFGKSKPIYLHIVGAGVLSRKVDEKPNYRQELIMNGDQNDFIFTSFSDGKNVAVSFVRKNVVELILTEIDEKKIHLLGFSCGPALYFSLVDDFKVNFDFKVCKKNKEIIDFQKSDQKSLTQEYNGQFVNQFEFIKLCALNAINDKLDGFEATGIDYCQDKKSNFEQYRRFKTIGLSALIVLFLVVIANRFYQNHLQGEIAQLENELSLNDNNLAYLDRLESEKNRKLELVASAGVTSHHFLGHYLDEIGKSVPKSIKLTSLDLFPVEGKLKNKEKVKIKGETILIEGSTSSSTVLDDWMEYLNTLEWIGKVELTNYLKDEYEQGVFVLMLNLN